TGEPVLVFLGHTDVVPTGPREDWISDPFQPEIRDGSVYGRGAADMKGSVAAMVTALERFVKQHPDHRGTVGLLLTSDEEGIAVNGVRRVMEEFRNRNISIDWCLVGEPSSDQRLGDVIRIGRRGSLGARLLVHGIQGHVAFPELANNPVHAASAALKDLCDEVWDQGNEHYPATSFQVSNIHAGTGADNVIPGELEVMFNFRFCTESTEETLKARVHEILDRYELDYDIDWRLSGQPFLTRSGDLLKAVQASIRDTCGIETVLSTGGGTSDGRFVAPTGAEVIELGPLNASIHKLNECTPVQDLETLTVLYEDIMKKLYN
ncbi:MAG: succinyl-diaminopimelate desuccinylase, partial [Gammaproteobacteria bacterium]|nr:succinyl-diaminopimelate desuccinylase [Gammaproteobacteria bacterium]